MSNYQVDTYKLITEQIQLLTDAQQIIEDYYVQGDEFNPYDGVAFCQRFLRYANNMEQFHINYAQEVTEETNQLYPKSASGNAELDTKD